MISDWSLGSDVRFIVDIGVEFRGSLEKIQPPVFET